MWPKQKTWVERWAEQGERKTGYNPLKRSTLYTRRTPAGEIQEFRDNHGRKRGEIISQQGGYYQELRDRHGVRLGWYNADVNMTYDAKTCCSVSQGNTLLSLLPPA